MIVFNSISMRNFWLCGNVEQTVRLSVSPFTLVLGENRDIEGDDQANGTGKSSSVQAILYCLFGEPLSDIKLDRLVNATNQKNMLCTLKFTKDSVDYEIQRGRKPNLLRLIVGGKERKDSDDALGTNSDTQKEINRVLGLSADLFQHVITLNTHTQPFLKMKPAIARPIFEELMGVTTLSTRDEKLAELITTTKKAVAVEEAKINANRGANARIQTNIDKIEQERRVWTVSQEAVIERLAEKIGTISDIDFDLEIEKFDRLDGWINEEKELTSAADSEAKNTAGLRRDRDRLLSEIERLQKETDGTSDTHIIRLESSAKIYDNEAKKGCAIEISRLETEAKRCRDEAAKGFEAEIARLNREKTRLENDAETNAQLVKTKNTEYITVCAEIENSDSHSCSSCGQNLSGTEHLIKVLTNLKAKKSNIERERTQAANRAESLQSDATKLALEIDVVKSTAIIKRDEWLEKANRAEQEIEDVKASQIVRQAEWDDKARLVRLEIDAAKNALEHQHRDISERIAGLEIEADILKNDITEHMDTEKEIRDAINLLGPKPTVNYKNREELWRLRQTLDALIVDLEREAERLNPYEGQINALRDTLVEISLDFHARLSNDLKHQDFLHKLLTTRDSFIRRKIIDRNLNQLNRRLNYYLTKIGLQHQVKYLSDLSVEITLRGLQFDYSQLSRGERNRLNLANCWAFRDTFEASNDSINLVFIDELADDGMDRSGMEATFDILTEMAHQNSKNVFFVTHHAFMNEKVEKVLLVRRQDNFSTFLEDAETI